QLVLVRGNLVDTDRAQVVDRNAKPDSAGNVRSTGFKLVGKCVEGGLFEAYRGNHIAAALIRRHPAQQIALSLEHADARRPEELVAGEGVEVAVQVTHIELDVRGSLRPVNKYRHVVTVRDFNDSLYRIDRSQ